MIELFSQDNRNSARISLLGAELVELMTQKHDDSLKPIVWKVDENYWNRVSPILFPLVGKVKDNFYRVNGKQYELPQHGFARNSIFELIEKDTHYCKLQLKSNEQTKEVYPFDFKIIVEYRLEADALHVSNTVVNTSPKETLLYSIGAHPGFQLMGPLQEYEIQLHGELGQPMLGDFALIRHLIQQGLYSGETEIVEFNNGKLGLQNQLFQSDAIVFKHEGITGISIFRGDEFQVRVNCNSAPYWGIWTKPGAPFLCLEPWDGLADRMNHDGDFHSKEGVIQLNSNGLRNFNYEIHW